MSLQQRARWRQSIKALVPPQTLAWILMALPPALFITVFFVYPVGTLLLRGVVDPAELINSLTRERSFKALRQTLLQSGGATLLSVLLGLPAAYVFHKLKFRGATVLRMLYALPFVLPTVVVGLAFNSLYGRGGLLYGLRIDHSFTLVLLALTFFNTSVISRTVGAVWAGMSSGQEQAARTLGASAFKAFCTVTLPRLAPAIGSAASLVFLYCATSFGIVFTVGGRKFANIESEIYTTAVTYLDFDTAAALSILQLLIVVASLYTTAALRRRGELLTLTGDPPAPPSTALDRLAVLLVIASFLLLQLAPIASLLWRSLTLNGRLTLANYVSLAAQQRAFSGSALDALSLSLKTALLATLITMLLAVPATIITSRKTENKTLRSIVGVMDTLLMLPVGMSAVTLGFGLLITMHQPFGLNINLRESPLLIPVAQALIALPIILKTLQPTLRGINELQRDCARTLGAGSIRVLLTIDLPQLLKPLAVAVGFTFAVSMGEFGASSFLIRPQGMTLPVLIGYSAGRPGSEAYGTATAAAVLLAAICACAIFLADYLAQKIQARRLNA